MQQFLDRKEIRRLLRASLGQTTDEGLATMNLAKLDVSIMQACLQAHADMRPLRGQVERTIDVGIQQSLIPFPADAGPASLTTAAVWDATAEVYRPLRRKAREVDGADDQALVAGGATMDAIVGMPQWIAEEAEGWRLYPTTDKAYRVRVYYAKRQAFTNDEELSTVDAMLILSYALYLETRSYDDTQAQRHLGDYQARKAALKGWEQTGAAIAIDPDCTFDDDERLDDPPNYDTRPARQS
jgi:hypothetical protein